MRWRAASGTTGAIVVLAAAGVASAASQPPAQSVEFTDEQSLNVKLPALLSRRSLPVRVTNLLARPQSVALSVVGLRPADRWSSGRFGEGRATLPPRGSVTIRVPLARLTGKPPAPRYKGFVVAVGARGPLARLPMTVTDTGVSAAANPCAEADALQAAHQDDAANTAYQDVLKADPGATCASDALRHRGLTGWLRHVLDVVTGLGLVVLGWLAVLVGVAALAVLAASQFVKSRAWLVNLPGVGVWLDRRLASRLALEDFGDDKGFTALVREQLVRETGEDAYRLDRVTARDSLGKTLGSVESVDPALKTLAAILDAVEQLMPRARLTASGAAQENEGPDGEGATVLLEGGPRTASTTLWIGSDAGAGHQSLAVPVAAWIDYEVHRALGNRPKIGDARSYALLQGALDAERRGDDANARRLYDQAKRADPMNIPAIINLANLKARGRREYLDAVRDLREAVELLHVTP